MRKAKAGVILALLVAASLGAGYLAENPSQHATASKTPTSRQASSSTLESSTTSSTAVSTVSSSGLELKVELNATAIEPGQTLAANVTLFNTLDENLSLPTSAQANLTSQITAWNNDDFVCGIGGLASGVAGFALFRGHVSGENLSLAPDPLQLAEVLLVPCNALPLGDSIVFQPHSENASISPHYSYVYPFSLNVTTSPGSGLFGYWNRTSYACCAGNANAPDLFRYFTPGGYTIAAEDIWGDRLFAYFLVTQGPSPSLAVSAQESPFSSEEHPIIGITLANLGNVPISSLNATLRYATSPNAAPLTSTSYEFTFNVNSSNPLLPGQDVQDVRTLQGNLFDISVGYPLTISGTLANGTEFAYTQQIQFVNSVPS